ncbi:predicted protein, partial [Nematostella vectensis]
MMNTKSLEMLTANGTQNIVLANTLHKRSVWLIVVESGILFVISFLALAGNILICAAVYRKPSLRTVTNMFIVSLAACDILMAAVAMPLSEGTLITGEWMYGRVTCQIQGFTIHLLVFHSVQVIMLTAINRNLSVVRPELYRRIFSKRATLVMILGVSVVSAAAMAALVFFLTSYFIFHPGKAICVVTFRNLSQSRQYTIIFAAIFIVVPFLVISVCYLRVIQTIRSHRREFESSRGVLDSSSVLLREEDKLSRIVLAIILGFAACWVPCAIIDIIDTTTVEWLPRQVYLLYMYLGYGSCLLNPCLYGGMNKQVRRE